MSVAPLECEPCGVARVFDRAGKFPEEGEEATYAVGWRCPRCDGLAVDLCPMGPVEPTRGSCLNCGTDVAGADRCAGCGMGRSETMSFLGVAAESERTLAHALSAFAEGRLRHGFAVLDRLLDEEPARAELWKEKAKALQSLNLDRAAARCYRRALALEPDPFVEIALACSLQDLGEHVDAVRVYDSVIRESDTAEAVAIAHANRGNAHAALGDIGRAKEDYEEAIRREPERGTHYLGYARLHVRGRRWADAVGVVERGLRCVRGEEAVPLLLEKARSSNEQEKADIGLEAADEVLSILPDHPRALYQRAWALGMLGRLEDASSSLNRLLELEPGNRDAQRALTTLQAAMPRTRPSRPWWRFWD